VHLVTGSHAEAQSRAAQSSGIRALWSVIIPKFSTHLEFTTIILHREYDSSSPDADQSASPHLRQGRLRTARVLAPLCNCNNSLTINSAYFFNEAVSASTVYHSRVFTRVELCLHPGNNVYDTFTIGTRSGYNNTSNQQFNFSSGERNISTLEI
jgi:hypothetical protein